MANFRFYLNGVEVSEPVGFDQINFNVIRSENHGIDQPFTNEVTFTGDLDKEPGLANGAKILRLVFENEFINGSVDVELVSNIKVNGETWSFNGKIDFSTYQEINLCDGCSDGVSVTINEDDFRELFRSRQDVEIDLHSTVDLDGNYIEPLVLGEVRLHSQDLFLRAIGKSLARSGANNIISSGGDPTLFSLVVPNYWSNSDFKENLGTGSTLNVNGIRRSNSNVNFINNGDSTRTIRVRGAGRITVNPNFTTGTGTNIEYQIFARVFLGGNYNTGTTFPLLYLSPAFPPLTESFFDWSIDETFTIAPDYGIIIQVGYGSLGGFTIVETSVIFEDNQELIIEEFSSSNASLCKGLYVIDFLKRVVLILTGKQNGLISDYFSFDDLGCMWNNLLTTGLYVRNGQLLDNANPQIKVTWKNLFENLSKAFRGLGWEFEPDGYNGYNIRVEPISYFYQDSVVVEFTNVSEIKRYAITDKLYNAFATGFTDKWKNQGISGLFAIHTERNYYVNNKALDQNSSAKLDLRSDIIFEGVAIEVNRRSQFVSDSSGSTDQPNDYDLFCIWLNPIEITLDPVSNGYQLPGETGSVTFPPGTLSYGSNFIGPNSSPLDRIYNVLHTPARITAGWWKWLGQNTFGLSGSNVRLAFQSGQYYTAFEMAVPDPCELVVDTEIREDTDIDPDLLTTGNGGYLVQPIGYEFEVPQELCDFLFVASEGKKIIKFSCGSSIFAGYILQGENQPGGTGLSKFTLIGTEIPVSGGAFSNGFSNGFL
jgi:hypothetical protein